MSQVTIAGGPCVQGIKLGNEIGITVFANYVPIIQIIQSINNLSSLYYKLMHIINRYSLSTWEFSSATNWLIIIGSEL